MNHDPDETPARSRRMIRSVAVGVLLATVAATTVVTLAQSNAFASNAPTARKWPTAPIKAPLMPAHGVLLGHYYGNGTMAQTDKRIGRKPAVHLTYYDFKSDNWARSATTVADLADGRIPLVNVEPNGIDFDDIVNGKYDALLRKRADEAKALKQRLFVDFAAEMNGDEGWGGHRPAAYIAAWRHIHDIFTARKATNVVWVWCPNNEDAGDSVAAMKYYPGDAYVDWTGIDGYNWGTSDPDFEWQSFRAVFASTYAQLAARKKPIIIGEMASDEVGASKAAWINSIVPTLKSDFPLIKAVVWFDVDKERHWQINSSSSALKAYRKLAKDPYLNP